MADKVPLVTSTGASSLGKFNSTLLPTGSRMNIWKPALGTFCSSNLMPSLFSRSRNCRTLLAVAYHTCPARFFVPGSFHTLLHLSRQFPRSSRSERYQFGITVAISGIGLNTSIHLSMSVSAGGCCERFTALIKSTNATKEITTWMHQYAQRR